MKLHWTQVCAIIAAVLLTTYAFGVKQTGFLDSAFFPFTYLLLAAAALAAAFRPSRATLRFAAAVGMAKGILRGVTIYISDENWGVMAFHFLFALMVYVIWRSFREQISPPGTRELLLAIRETETENVERRELVAQSQQP